MALAALALLAGCAVPSEPALTPEPTPAPAVTPSPTPTPEAKGPAVQTDWSKLEPREKPEAVGRRWYADHTTRLIPLDYGGDLIPYAGLRIMEDWPARDGGGCLYGLMTLDGTVVVDPAYSRAVLLEWNQWWEQDMDRVLPILGLCVGIQKTDGEYFWGEDRWAFAGIDGAWVTEHKYLDYAAGPEGVFASTEQGCEVLDLAGDVTRAWTWAELGYSEEKPAHFTDGPDAYYIEWLDGLVQLEGNEEQARVLDTATGAVSTISRQDWEARREEPGQGWSEDRQQLDPYTGQLYTVEGDTFSETMVLRDAGGQELARIDRPGWYSSLKLVGGLAERVDRDYATYTDREGNVVFRALLNIGDE